MNIDCYEEFNAIRDEMVYAFASRDIYTFSILLSRLNKMIIKLEDKISKQKFDNNMKDVNRIIYEINQKFSVKDTPKDIF